MNLLREFSIPLIAGVLTALAWVNAAPDSYRQFNHGHFWGPFSFHFVTNDIFMVFFFGLAAVEITQSCLPGGDLNPVRKAVNPLLATLGGVIGPVAVYLLLNSLIGSPALTNGWGIPTATDIALAWLAARLIFGNNHPVIAFLLLLAIADDAIGLVIIALFYPDPHLPAEPSWLILIARRNADRLRPAQPAGEKLLALPPLRRRSKLARPLQCPPPPGPGAGVRGSVPAAPPEGNHAPVRGRPERLLHPGPVRT